MTVVFACLNDTTAERQMAAPTRAKAIEEGRYAGNVNSKDGAAHETLHISAATIRLKATGGNFNRDLLI